MTKRGAGSRAGAWVLSARFLAWARANGRADLISEIDLARAQYKESGADTSRYEALSDEDLEERRAKANGRLKRLTTEAARREGVTDEIPAAASEG